MKFRKDCHSFIYLTKDQIPAQARCDVPETIDGQPGFLFRLASDWVYQARPIARTAVGSYPTFSPLPPERGGLFSVALSVNLH